MTKRKKIIVLTSMVALLVITGILNVVLNSNLIQTNSSNTEYSSASFFSTYRTDRTNTRNEAIEYYKDLISNTELTNETKLEYEAKIDALISAMSTELSMETMIKSKGFSEALVSYSDTYINVIVKSAELNENEVAQIVEVVQSQSDNRDIDFIKIIPVE